MAVYDPLYQNSSLGLYTLYKEIEWGIAQQRSYYYPGYVSPDTTLFNYKHKAGKLEFWHLTTRSWLPYEHFAPTLHSPLGQLNAKLDWLEDQLQESSMAFNRYLYVFFDSLMIVEDPSTAFLHLRSFYCTAPHLNNA
ncbi:MAG: hypothetical protein R2795_18320 [Saprospiraceae bacterium]